MRIMMLFGLAFALLCLPIQGESKREVLAGSADAAPPPKEGEKLQASGSAADLDPPLPPGPQDWLTGLQIALHGCNNHLNDCPVVEVAKNTITIFHTGWSGWSQRRNGEWEWQVVPTRRVRLPVSKNVADGSDLSCASLGSDARYPLSAVEVGDRVTLEINNVDGRYTCTGICIWRRPGGLVPKAPEDKGPEDAHHHYEGANALQDLEFKGVPLPRKYFFLNNNGTLPKHRQGIVAYPGVMPIIRPLANGTRRLFR